MNVMMIICIAMLVISSMCITSKTHSAIQKQYEEITVIEKENEELLKEIEEKDKEIAEKDKENEKLKKESEEYKEKLEEYELMEKEIPVGNVGNVGIMKSYMDYRCIGRGSRQGGIVYGEEAWTDEDGMRRWGEWYCVALGSYYGAVGDKFWVETDKGNRFKVVKGEEKCDNLTDETNRYTVHNGCMLEFIVDVNKLDKKVRISGSINNIEKFSGKIIKITKVIKNEKI